MPDTTDTGLDPANLGDANDAFSDSDTDSSSDEDLDTSELEGAEDTDIDQTGDSEEDSDESDDDAGEEDTEDDLPFHNHPRWKKQRQKIRDLEKKLDTALADKGQQDSTKTSNQKHLSESTDVDKMFENLPERKFKDKYSDYKDFYKDIRRAIMSDLLDTRDRQKSANTELVNQYNNQLEDIREEIGDSRYEGFVQFAYDTLEEDPNADLGTMYRFYSKHLIDKGEPARKESKKKAKAKINRKSSNGGRPKTNKPTLKELRSKSLQEIMDEQINKN